MAMESEQQILISLSKTKIMDTLHHSIAAWIARAQQPGGFLTAVFSNDLKDAMMRGDDEAIASIPEIIRWLHKNAPGGCWGHANSIDFWQRLKRRS